MGGLGSGRPYHYSAADCTADYRRLDVRNWQRGGLLKPGYTFSTRWINHGEVVGLINVKIDADRVVLDYRHRRENGEWKDENYPVRLDWTPCTYGGRRAWFLCPAVGCGRRVAVLYGGGIFACRHCYRLAYRCQRENENSRKIRRADKIRERLGWVPGVINPPGDKPKGMHWKTFWNLSVEHHTVVIESLSSMAQGFGIKIKD